ncbi:alpha/beta hydrolase [Flavobacterium sp. ASW18X]|uniref:alpha/beta hydrolase n=1 Tax=Flavobacterium sp. ASW18X TaxID=2572595 RepID=UPI00146C6798|nr:alpha/beta hydrolase [Flavobacterium sp. ASW18X]
MSTNKIHVYFVPGMAASPAIFDHIQLDPELFTCHFLKWHLPDKKTTLKAYAQQMAHQIKHTDPVLIGVSFGGLVVQEMAKFLKVRKLIIISSVKTYKEMPKRIRLARLTQIHRIFPMSIFENVEFLAKYAMGEKVKNRLKLYQIYLDVRDRRYLHWAINQIVNWKQELPLKNIIHIHGDTDKVFPVNNIKNCITVNNGKHTMIIYRAKWFNEHLPAIILEESDVFS